MEYFARCPTTLSKWARHYLTGQKMPPQLLETALEGTALLPAVDLQMQILYSAVDQVKIFSCYSGSHLLCSYITPVLYVRGATFPRVVFHFACACIIHFSLFVQHVFGTGLGDVSSLSSQEVFARANRDLLAVQQQYTVLPMGEFASMNMLDHGHLVNYGGTLATPLTLLLSLEQ